MDFHFHKLDVSHAELRPGLRTANLHLSPFACHIFTLVWGPDGGLADGETLEASRDDEAWDDPDA